jgi:N-methylhydantoinase B/oxoprolinase/acetone carboxylase alpha subunit
MANSDVSSLDNRIDPIVAPVIQHRLMAIVEEMGEVMLRISYSQILNSSRDFSTAICGLDGRLIAQPEHVPIHVGALPMRPGRSAISSLATSGRMTSFC